MIDPFVLKLQNASQSRHSRLILLISPVLEKLPLPMQRFDEPLLPFGKAVIDATKDRVCGYAFDLEAYLVTGAAGMIALERTMNYVPADLIAILHGAFFTNAVSSMIAKTGWNLDGVTVSRRALIDDQLPDVRSRLLLISEHAADPPEANYNLFSLTRGVVTIVNGDEQPLQFALAGDAPLHTSQGDDFAETARIALERLNRQAET